MQITVFEIHDKKHFEGFYKRGSLAKVYLAKEDKVGRNREGKEGGSRETQNGGLCCRSIYTF
jgi:hypothetical protein